MRISEVVAKTGIPKRTIYFYIKEKLLLPREDPINGYHDFSEEDVTSLIIISRLRKLDFPLADIRTILRFPGTASYYFYQQMDILTERIEYLRRNVDAMARTFENEPVSFDRNALAASLEQIEDTVREPVTTDAFNERDAKIIPLFIWSPYLNKSKNEYQEFIWSKISKKVIADYQPFLRSMKRIISSLEPEQLQYSSERTSRQSGEIAALTPATTEDYARKVTGQIRDFIDNQELVAKWNLVYQPLIYPLLTIGYSEISNMMFELNDEYKHFYDNVCILCDYIWRFMMEEEKGQRLYEDITRKLKPIDWDMNGRGELERMSVFSFSPYAVLNEKEIERILYG